MWYSAWRFDFTFTSPWVFLNRNNNSNLIESNLSASAAISKLELEKNENLFRISMFSWNFLHLYVYKKSGFTYSNAVVPNWNLEGKKFMYSGFIAFLAYVLPVSCGCPHCWSVLHLCVAKQRLVPEAAMAGLWLGRGSQMLFARILSMGHLWHLKAKN